MIRFIIFVFIVFVLFPRCFCERTASPKASVKRSLTSLSERRQGLRIDRTRRVQGLDQPAIDW